MLQALVQYGYGLPRLQLYLQDTRLNKTCATGHGGLSWLLVSTNNFICRGYLCCHCLYEVDVFFFYII